MVGRLANLVANLFLGEGRMGKVVPALLALQGYIRFLLLWLVYLHVYVPKLN